MSLSFEFQEQLRAIEESIKPVDLTSEISQFQDEVREGYVPEKKAAPETDAVVAQDVGALARCHGLTRPVSTISQSA